MLFDHIFKKKPCVVVRLFKLDRNKTVDPSRHLCHEMARKWVNNQKIYNTVDQRKTSSKLAANNLDQKLQANKINEGNASLGIQKNSL